MPASRLSDVSLSAVTAGFVAVLAVGGLAGDFGMAEATGAVRAFWGVVAGALALFVQQWRPGAGAGLRPRP